MWAWFATFAALVVLTRLWFLNLEEIDWDESTYLLRAANLWDAAAGRLEFYYVRPFTGILYALTALFGDSLLVVRGFGAVCIFTTACFTFLSCRRALGAHASALGVGVAIVGLSAPELQATFTEHSVIVFLAIVIWLLVERPRGLWSAFLVGVCMSLATLTRMNIAYTVLALGCYYTAFLFRHSGPVHRLAVFAYGFGGALPLLVLAAIYWVSGAMDRFILYVFGILLSYAFDQMPLHQVLGLQIANWVRFVTQDALVYGLLSLFLLVGAVVIVHQSVRQWRCNATPPPAQRRLTFMNMLLGIPVLLSILTGGSPYTHYWIQLFPFVAFLVAAALAALPLGPIGITARVAAIVVIQVPTILYGVGAVQLASNWSDLAAAHFIRQAADRIAADRRLGDRMYALHHHLVLWYLHEPPLSPIVSHPTDIVQEPVMKPLIQAGLIHADEFARILASRPRYVVKKPGVVAYLENRPEGALLEKALAMHYELWVKVRNLEVYRLR